MRINVRSEQEIFSFIFTRCMAWWRNVAPEDSVASILKQGTLSIGFIGLAECLVALTGKHHGKMENHGNLGMKLFPL